MNAEQQAILSRASAVEARRQAAVRRGDGDAETAALLELVELEHAFAAAERAGDAQEHTRPHGTLTLECAAGAKP